MLDHLSGATRLFPIIGDAIEYAESSARLTRSFGARGRNAVCVPMQVPRPALDDVIRGLSATPNVDGLLVTMPHKRTAFGYCATRSERATLLGVGNVLRRHPDGTWHGDMLDGLAFVKAQNDHGARPTGSRVLLLGDVIAGHGLTPFLAARPGRGRTRRDEKPDVQREKVNSHWSARRDEVRACCVPAPTAHLWSYRRPVTKAVSATPTAANQAGR